MFLWLKGVYLGKDALRRIGSLGRHHHKLLILNALHRRAFLAAWVWVLNGEVLNGDGTLQSESSGVSLAFPKLSHAPQPEM